MKRVFLYLMVMSSYIWASDLSVEVIGVDSRVGAIYIGLFDNESNFGKISKVYRGKTIPITSNTIEYTFRDIPNGVYAISIFHDSNNNQKLDKNLIGMPIEGYGFSNDIRPTFRGATFKEAQFRVEKSIKIDIKMEY